MSFWYLILQLWAAALVMPGWVQTQSSSLRTASMSLLLFQYVSKIFFPSVPASPFHRCVIKRWNDSKSEITTVTQKTKRRRKCRYFSASPTHSTALVQAPFFCEASLWSVPNLWKQFCLMRLAKAVWWYSWHSHSLSRKLALCLSFSQCLKLISWTWKYLQLTNSLFRN